MSLTVDQISSIFETYGKIKTIMSITNGSYIIKYEDKRGAEDAIRVLHGVTRLGYVLAVTQDLMFPNACQVKFTIPETTHQKQNSTEIDPNFVEKLLASDNFTKEQKMKILSFFL